MESDYPLISSPERQLQRCDSRGRRQVVGCIPYRYRSGRDELELLLVRSRNGPGMKFPKVHGVFSKDETVTVDEARNLCQHWWINEALDVLVERCTSSGTHEEEIPLFARQNSASQLIVASPEIENSYNMDIEPDNSNIEHITHDGTNGWSQKVTKLK
ncbi:hypothetical protein Patl1_15520 [Pistacia atlantica]|uniref:Uncharacterized protein n=1 Tax=Pistacia atlantica TaxID=434234 RepID=A0ACC1BBC2_9ROSI|nr:hypothetical protein Patl1_15520 [Pistacia atlantica]